MLNIFRIFPILSKILVFNIDYIFQIANKYNNCFETPQQVCFSIENFIIYTLLVGDIYTELKINEVRYKICDDLSFTFGYVRLFSDFSCIINIILLQEKKKFSSGNISYSDDDSSTEYSSDSDDMNIDE